MIFQALENRMFQDTVLVPESTAIQEYGLWDKHGLFRFWDKHGLFRGLEDVMWQWRNPRCYTRIYTPSVMDFDINNIKF